VLIAAALCPAPPLLAREVTGLDPVLPELRAACLQAARELTAGRPDLLMVVGVSAETREWSPRTPLDLRAWAPGVTAGREVPGGAVSRDLADAGDAAGDIARNGTALPLGLGLGRRLLDQAGYAGPLFLQSVAADEPPAACAELGGALAGRGGRLALLVMADGGARRGLKAPGYLDERCAAFDAGVEAAIRDGDLAALLAVDAELAAGLMATGRPAWQVLAGAAGRERPQCTIRYSGDPFGVAYLVSSLSLTPAGTAGQVQEQGRNDG
jgi:hypothetical protein